MESPPSSSIWSEAFILSDDSGLLLTSGSISSGSMSGESRPLALSDIEDKSDSLDGMSDIMGGENFNTLKKGPNYTAVTIDPPPEFQDEPHETSLHILITDNICFLPIWLDKWASKMAKNILKDSFSLFIYKLNTYTKQRKTIHSGLTRAYWTSDWLPFSPCHGRPGSRASLGSSRLSSSHNSLSIPAAHKVDDSSFITQAVSHDTLSSHQISDLYNVPFDSDIYTVPVDTVRQPFRTKPRKRRRYTAAGCRDLRQVSLNKTRASCNVLRPTTYCMDGLSKCGKRHSMPGTSTGLPTDGEPIHMTLQEVRQYLQTLYSSSSDSSENNKQITKIYNNKYTGECTTNSSTKETTNTNKYNKKNLFMINIKTKKVKDSCQTVKDKQEKNKKLPSRNFSLKQTLCNIFRFKKFVSPDHLKLTRNRQNVNLVSLDEYAENLVVVDKPLASRALPPLPADENGEEPSKDFATSIQKVKDYGWYWGPLSGEAAEKILSNEPDGSFIVRDSSDDHYIFSLTFKLHNCVRHVRIEHDQGNFSFGSCTKFKSQTIVEFIENAVEHSRSGRYLFFLHRRPVLGPMRVQLLHPVSRFKQTQSLQHMCRFVILKLVRRDLIPSLPLPRRVIDYLNTPHYYSEHMFELDESEESTEPLVSVSATRQS